MIKIVLVDDHKMFLDGMVSVLSQEPNMEVLFVENYAKGALRKIKNETPDLIITDMSMPEMNGLEFIKILKNDYPKIKILVVTMFHSSQKIDGIHGLLLKQSNKEEFIKAINTITIENGTYFQESTSDKANLDFKKAILSTREKEIIQLIANEHTSDEIAEKLFLSRGTVETHRKNIFFKLQVKNIAGLIKKGVELGFIES
jgi:DNA-binding NarL/FixJ family response regulator